MDNDNGNGSDNEVEDVAANNTHNVVLVTLWAVASKWQREVLVKGSNI